MKKFVKSLMVFSFTMLISLPVSAGNEPMVKNRINELNAFSRDAINQIGPKPENGKINIIKMTMDKQTQQPPDQWYLYIRKSTDEEGKQVLSLEAQLTELKEFAQRENVEIAETFVEKRTAKIPGRPVFNEMLSKMETSSKRIGILSWAPDRLSRNSIDAGKIVYLLDTGKIASLKFPTFAFENNPSGKFFLSIGLSNAKYYVDSLAENVRRGNRA